MVKVQDLYFKVFPKVVRADKEAIINIKPLYDHVRFNENSTYEVVYFPVDNRSVYSQGEKTIVKPEDGVISVKRLFEGEQEHILYLYEVVEDKPRLIADFRIYSLREDLFELKPYKGDMHIHSNFSDGKEDPALVAAACRKIGLDFMAVTDHGKYAPSIKAQEAFENVDIDLKIYRGEEVHPPQNPVHMINFGGRFSVNDLFKEDVYMKEVKEIEKALVGFQNDETRYQYASCKWCFDKIREGGGLGIFCHPYWLVSGGYNESTAITHRLMEDQPYDALELLGGYFKHEMESNVLQLALYSEYRSKGKDIPIVGVSDAHGCFTGYLFGWYYTIVFAKDSSLNSLIEGIKGLNSVAVEEVKDETPRIYGPLRLVKYAYFLFREVLPLHDAMCEQEGSLMMRYLEGDEKAAEMLKNLKGQTEKLYNELWSL